MSGKLAATIIASKCESFRNSLQRAFASRHFRPYTSDDVAGVQIAGALKNVYAILCGFIDGLGLGNNAKGGVIARALAEMIKFGDKLGASPLTFAGIAGIGDLIATAFSPLSRNYQVGRMLASGKTISEIQSILNKRNEVAEGINTTFIISYIAEKMKVEMPLLLTVKKIIEGHQDTKALIEEIMTRPLTSEYSFTLK